MSKLKGGENLPPISAILQKELRWSRCKRIVVYGSRLHEFSSYWRNRP